MIKKVINNFKIGTIWISGLTASGKTTLGKLLFQDLKKYGINNIKFLDGDELRSLMTKKYGRDLKDRYKILKEYIKITIKENKKGNIVIISTISHKTDMRMLARREINNFMEVNLECSVRACSQRDYKGLYSKMKNRSKDFFPGISEPYEFSESPELIINTENNSIEFCRKIMFNKAIKHLSFSNNN